MFIRSWYCHSSADVWEYVYYSASSRKHRSAAI